MKLSLSHHIMTFLALFALLGQGLVTNGYAMVMPSMTHDAYELASNTNVKHHMGSAMASSADEEDHSCCDTMPEMVKMASSACCDSVSGCSIDCGHCLTISMTGHLQSLDITLATPINIKAEATALPHFFFHQTLPAFKPPIV
ncbi:MULTISPECIES: hypothetical protein [Shewanella]|uniref:hypothetical protein n=1 Tax=Shewanella TaxID=22 RepID=UPI0013C50E48|nr:MULTISPECIES: hypothetical protein [Shewanella]